MSNTADNSSEAAGTKCTDWMSQPIGTISRLMGIDNLTLAYAATDMDNIRTETWEHVDGRMVSRSIDLDADRVILITLFPAIKGQP